MKLQGIVRNLESRLEENEISRIIENNIFISLVSNPASRIRYGNNPFRNLDNINLVTIDFDFCNKYIHKPGHLEAVILHEVGHILNEPTTKK